MIYFSRSDIPEDVKSLLNLIIDDRTEEEYHSLVTNIPAVIWKTDASGITTYISPMSLLVYIAS